MNYSLKTNENKHNFTSEYTGVYFDKVNNNYKARITIDKKQVHIISTKDELRAGIWAAVAEELKELCNGDYAKFRKTISQYLN